MAVTKTEASNSIISRLTELKPYQLTALVLGVFLVVVLAVILIGDRPISEHRLNELFDTSLDERFSTLKDQYRDSKNDNYNYVILINAAGIYEEYLRHDKALLVLEEAKNFVPDQKAAEYYHILAEVYEKSGDLDRAITIYEKSSDLFQDTNPDQAAAIRFRLDEQLKRAQNASDQVDQSLYEAQKTSGGDGNVQ